MSCRGGGFRSLVFGLLGFKMNRPLGCGVQIAGKRYLDDLGDVPFGIFVRGRLILGFERFFFSRKAVIGFRIKVGGFVKRLGFEIDRCYCSN